MKKVLIVRFSSIGDIVLTTPIIRCLKLQRPELEIHFLTKNSFASILENNPYVDKVFSITKSTSEILPQLKNEGYDFIVDLHKNTRTRQLKMALRKPSRSYPKLNFKKFLLTNFKIDKMPKVHIVDRYFEAVKILGITNDQKGLDYFIPEKDEINIDSQDIPKFYIAFAIGAQFATKKLPENKIIELLSKTDKSIVLLGGENDRKLGEKIANKLAHVISKCGDLNLNQSASVLKQAEKVISHDTGLMHIASAFQKPIISIWGNTVPSIGMYPYLPQKNAVFSIHEVDGLKCRPCSKIGYQKCPKGHFNCMNNQDLDAIAGDLNG